MAFEPDVFSSQHDHWAVKVNLRFWNLPTLVVALVY